MNLRLNQSAAPLFAAGFLATAMLFSGLSAGATAFGVGVAQFLSEPVFELIASFVGGATSALVIGRGKL
jgi:hypothetical protein